MRAGRLLLTVGNTRSKEEAEVQKTLALTAAVVVLVAIAAAGSLFTLTAVSHSHQTCGRVNQADLRAAAAPDYAKKLERLARCGS
jgi:hypothetical protein